MKGLINYCTQDKKVHDDISQRRLVGGVNCDGENAFTEFMVTKKSYGKVKGTNFYQYVQSFSPNEDITPEQVHKIGLEFAEKAWQGHEVLVTTHSDADHLHNHFVINSVSFETGLKLNQPPNTVVKLRGLNDELCKKYGYSTLETYTGKGDSLSPREYRAADNGQSWKFKLMADINDAMKRSGSRNAFIKEMNKKGYQVLWTSERKYITFTCPNGKKCRDIKLHDKKYEKENLEYEFYYRQKELYHSKFGGEKLTEYAKPYAEFNASDGSDSGKGLGYNAGYSADQRRVLSEGVGNVLKTDYGTTDESPAGGVVGIRAGKVQPSTVGSGRIDSNPTGSYEENPSGDEGLRGTGWEETRKDYERFIGKGFGAAQGNRESQGAAGHKNISYPLGDKRELIGSGIGSLGNSLSSVFITDDEDEEERRKRIQAQENGQDIGALLGLAAGVLIGATEDQDDDEALTMDEL
jgi:hypothetical protein